MKESEYVTGNIYALVKRLKREVRNETLAEIADMLYTEADKREKLLRTREHYRILALAKGDKYFKLVQQRKHLTNTINTLRFLEYAITRHQEYRT